MTVTTNPATIQQRPTADTRDYEHTYPGHALPPARAGQASEPVRTFDLRTSEERLVMWCANLERRIEDQGRRITHLELAIHRLLNAGEQEAQP